MVKFLDSVDQSVTLDLNDFRTNSIVKYGTTYYMIDVVSTVMKVYSYNSSWGAKTEVKSVNPHADYDKNLTICSVQLVANGGTDYMVCCWRGQNDLDTVTRFYRSVYNFTLSSWADNDDDLTGLFYDFVYFYTATLEFYCAWCPADNKLTCFGGPTQETIAGVCTRPYIYDDSNIRYILYDGAGNYYLRNWNASTFAFSTITNLSSILSGGGDLVFNTSFFVYDAGVMMAGWKNNFWMYENATVGWQQYLNSTADYPAPTWYYSGGEQYIRYVIYGNRLVLINNGSVYAGRLGTSHSLYCGWDDYFIDRNKKVWKLGAASQTSTTMKKLQVPALVMSIPAPIFANSNVAPLKQEFVHYYNDSSVLELKAFITNYKYDLQQYEIELTDPIKYDLEKAIDYDPAGKKAHEIIKDIIDTECRFATYDVGATTIDTNCTHEYNQPWINKSIASIFTELAKSEGYWWWNRPDWNIWFDQAAASGITITSASDGLMFATKTPIEKIPLPKSHIILTGRWNPTTNQYYTLEDAADANTSLYYDDFPNADDTELTQIMIGLKTLLNLENTIARFGCYNKAVFVGHSITLTLSAWSITADTYYVQEVVRDVISNVVWMVATAALSIPKSDSTSKMERRVENVEERVATIQQMLSTSTSLTENSDERIATQKATKTYVDNRNYFCRLRKNTTQSIPNSTTTRLTWGTNDTEVEDTFGMHTATGNDPAADADCQITVPIAGIYHIELNVSFAGITATQIQCWIRIEEETLTDRAYLGIVNHNNGGTTDHLHTSCDIRLAANERVEAWVYQNSGGAINVLSLATNPYDPSTISVKWSGA